MVIVYGSDFSQTGYVAPNVFLRKGGSIPGWNYYGSLTEAAAAFIDPDPVHIAGTIYFVNNGLPQTMGINVDFYVIIDGKWTPVNFSYILNNPNATGVIRFFDTNGNGAFYTIWNPYYFGSSATVVGNYTPEKIAALDSFYREVALLKYRYNSLVGFLNSMALRQLNTREQQIFNEGILKLQNISNQINSIDGIEIKYSDKGAVIGIIPIILIIVIILILASATAWTVSTVLAEQEKTKRINDSFELNKWIAEKKLQLSTAVTAGTITQSQANDINKTLDAAASIGNQVAVQSTKETESLFTQLGSLVKWGVVGAGIYFGYKLFKKPGNGSN
jgi:hypothetical protein